MRVKAPSAVSFRVAGLFIRPLPGSAGATRDSLRLVEGKGVEGDHGFGRSAKRQISLGWVEALGRAVEPFRPDRPLREEDFQNYRANVLLEGGAADLLRSGTLRGKFVGPSGEPIAELRITDVRSHCFKMRVLGSWKAADALDRESAGALARIEKVYGGGELRIGDRLELV